MNQSHGLHVAAQGRMANAAVRKIREVPASTKARILVAAEEVFAAEGFAGASTREIAAKAGVNISSLHYHWESKETLYDAVVQNVYSQLMEVSRDSGLPSPARGDPPRAVHEASLGRMFDCFAANPNIPRLLLRRLLEAPDSGGAIDPDSFLTSWANELGGWRKHRGGKRIRDIDAPIVVLTLYSALLLFTVDSRLPARLLGGPVADPEIARRVRAHLVELCARLAGADAKAST